MTALAAAKVFVMALIVTAIGVADAFHFHQFGTTTDLLLIGAAATGVGLPASFQAGLNSTPGSKGA